MQLGNRLFPYPVLNNERTLSTFDEESAFELKLTLDKNGEIIKTRNETILKDIYFSLNNKYLMELYKDKKIKCFLIVESPSSIYREKYELFDVPQTIEIKTNNLKGDVSISAYCVAVCDIEGYQSESFDEDYKDYSFDIKKYDIVAADDGIKFVVDRNLDEDNKASSIFTIVKNQDSTNLISHDMNQDKISKLIKDLRKKNNLTQNEFAKEFNVTYQAVSKWENGKNLPDINVLKEICDKYNLNINDFLEGKSVKNNKRNKIIVILIMIILLLISVFSIIFSIKKNSTFEFKKLHAECEDFNIKGVIAYNNISSSIYISELSYCGKKDKKLYKNFKCTLYEMEGDINKRVSMFEKSNKEGLKLDRYLKDVSFNIKYDKVCKNYKKGSVYLDIEATGMDDVITTYHVPLNIDENCGK